MRSIFATFAILSFWKGFLHLCLGHMMKLPLRSDRKGIEIQRGARLRLSLPPLSSLVACRRRTRFGRGGGSPRSELTVGAPHVGGTIALHPVTWERVANMECRWPDLVVGLEEEPERSLALVVGDAGAVDADAGVESIFYVAPNGVVEKGPTVDAPIGVDWDSLEIFARNEEEGRLERVDDNKFYELLGLRAEDEQADRNR
uniref:Uncharacterized protein n=1 Tax=Oryza meridionalis TaxID=40149 RepID=A0A0E0EL52_9ORYZ